MKPKRYWYNWDNIKHEIEIAFPNLIAQGICPSSSELRSAKIFWSVSKEITKIEELADKLGCKLKNGFICRDGHRASSSYECIVDEYLYSRCIEHIIHPKINERYFADFKVGNNFIEIWGYRKEDNTSLGKQYNHKRQLKQCVYDNIGGLINIECSIFHNPNQAPLSNIGEIESILDDTFSKLGYSVKKIKKFNEEVIVESGFLWSNETIIEKIQAITNKIGHFPSIKEMQEEEKLFNQVRRFGGIAKFRKLMNQVNVNDHRQFRTGWTHESLVDSIIEWVDKLDRFPTQKELQKYDGYLLQGLISFGGMEKYKKLMNLENRNPKGYWNENRVLDELRKIGYVPTSSQLLKMMMPKLLEQINIRGGKEYFRNLLKNNT